MSDVLFELPSEDAPYEPTYTDVRPTALLAKEAWANRLRRGTDASWVLEPVETRTDSLVIERTGDVLSSPITPNTGRHEPWEDAHQFKKSSEVLSDEMSADEFLVFLSMVDSTAFLEPLIGRIEELTELARLEEDQNALSPFSLRGLFRFLYSHRSRIHSRPQLILTTEGLLRAIWRRSRDHRVAIRFLDAARVSFVAFLPDHVRPTQINRIGGESSIEGFFRCVGLEAFGLEFESY